jgi:uridine kinase
MLMTGEIIYLAGANGSGKSSFLKQVLLPKLKTQPNDFYTLYLEQFFHLQAYVVRAQAALMHPQRKLQNSFDCLAYLLDDLSLAQQKVRRPVFVLADESRNLLALSSFLQNSGFDYCLVYSIHGENPLSLPYRSLQFESLNTKVSIIR